MTEFEKVKQALPELNELYRKKFYTKKDEFYLISHSDEQWYLYFKGISFYGWTGIEEQIGKGCNENYSKAKNLAIIFNNFIEIFKIDLND